MNTALSKNEGITKSKKKIILLVILGTILLLIAFCTMVVLSKKSQATNVSTGLLSDIKLVNTQPAYNKVQNSGCETQAGAFTQWYLKCTVTGEKFYQGRGDTASLVHDLNALDKKLRVLGWRTYDDASSATSHVPTVEDVELGRPNGTALWTIYYMPSRPNLQLTLIYMTAWTASGAMPYKSINKYPNLSGDDYLFGFSLFNDYISISS